jgi:hypothetical protein
MTSDGHIRDKQGRPVMFPGSNRCVDCGEPYTSPGLTKRCRKRHDIQAGKRS